MRENLAKREGERSTWSATFVRFGTKLGFRGEPPITTLLLRDVRDILGKVVTDHLWFTMTKEFERLPLADGVEVVFEARVTQYEKGYRGPRGEGFEFSDGSIDYRLSRPTNVRLREPPPPTSEWIPDVASPAPPSQLGLFG